MLINTPAMPKKLKTNFSPSGDRKKPAWRYEYNEALKCPTRVLNGYVDLQDFIQQSADDVDFKAIGKMLVDTKANVIDHFVSRDGEVVDVTGMPRNVHEFEALHNKLRKEFDALPADMKILFDNDFNLFSSAYRKGTIGTTLDTYFKSKAEPAKTEVVENGTKE